jgi:sigma-B regulation protein RsbU (phosphoserine phosphatase)
MRLFDEHQSPTVLTDWLMPGLTGIELCKQIRQQIQKSDTYITILTGPTERDELAIGLEAGADDCLPNPFFPANCRPRGRES